MIVVATVVAVVVARARNLLNWLDEAPAGP